MYVVLAILFGGVDPILRQPVPVWNPYYWDFAQFKYVWEHIVGPDAFFRPALVRTVVYVGVSSLLCLVIAYPVAYYTARFAGRWKGAPARRPDRAVLDQLHDADAGLGEPAPDRRAWSTRRSAWAGSSRSTSTGSAGDPRP